MSKEYIRMKGFYQVSYRSSTLVSGNNYKVTSVEGGEITAKKLVESGLAVYIDNPKTLSNVRIPRSVIVAERKTNNEGQSNTQEINVSEIRKSARGRKRKIQPVFTEDNQVAEPEIADEEINEQESENTHE
jgi:hypothetical protein